MVGSAIVRKLYDSGYENLLLRSHSELNLIDQNETFNFINKERPGYIFFAAAKVGGILTNNVHRAEFIYQNLMMELNVIHSAWLVGVKRLLFMGSSCIYPRDCPQPIKEEYLLTGPLEMTNEPYALAKIAGLKMCESYNLQYGTAYVSVMPTNLYGLNDNYDLNSSHVLPALIRKAHEAKMRGGDGKLTVWGTGKPRREFLYVDDLAQACVLLMERDDIREGMFNIGIGKDITIAELAKMVCEVVGFTGEVFFDETKPDGTPQKLLNVARIEALGWKAATSLKIGITAAYKDYLANTM